VVGLPGTAEDTEGGSAPRWRRDAFGAVVLALAVAYVGLALTPSSYGVVLQLLHLRGPVLGEAQWVRADEWAIWTPYVQAAVRNGFQRFNHTSIYGEDLRNFNGLPLADWSLVFKPYFWPFFLTGAARAFSFYHAFFFVAFLLGYRNLLRWLGLQERDAVLASLLLFFSGYVQGWWTTYGTMIAGFPWLLLLAGSPRGPWLRVPLLAYVTASWFLAHLYPPLMITLAFAGGMALLAFKPASLAPRRLVVSGLGLVLGALILVLYLHEVIPVMSQTLYPGQRERYHQVGSPVQWLSHLLPFLATYGFESHVNINFCEASTLGTYLPLLLLVFADHRALARTLRARDARGSTGRWRLTILGAGVAMTSCWILLPLPAVVGRPLLWNYVVVDRMWLACGLLLFLFFLAVFLMVRLRVTAVRLALACAVVLGSWIVSERGIGGTRLAEGYEEVVVLAPLALWFAGRGLGEPRLKSGLLACAAIANVFGFGLFNPFQPAQPIFDRPETPVTRALDRLARRHERGWLVSEALYGASLNGLGFRSAKHVLLAPRPEFFRGMFPGLPEAEREELFNRFLHVQLGLGPRPTLLDFDTVQVPARAFGSPVPVSLGPLVGGEGLETAGAVESVRLQRDGEEAHVMMDGWSPCDLSRPATGLRVCTDPPARDAAVLPVLRYDVSVALGDLDRVISGFSLRVDLPPGADEAAAKPRVCVAVGGPECGPFLLRGSADLDACRAMGCAPVTSSRPAAPAPRR
jgi:hypothetical protein